MRQTLTFSATIEGDLVAMKTMAVTMILALLTISGAVISDQLLTSEVHATQSMN
jgi:hypothetical protein